jgi:hypothetical protein
MKLLVIPALISVAFVIGGTFSKSESYDFFDEPDEVWKLRKARAFRQSSRQVKFHQAGRSGLYFQSNWEPDISCAFEERVGNIGDGGKWVCDVVKLANRSNSCLVYSVGSRGEFSFEEELHRRLPHCEVHVFDHTLNHSRPGLLIPEFLTFHDIGLGEGPGLMTFEAMRTHLNHKVIVDILKIDIDGAEYNVMMPLPSQASQVLIEIHPNKQRVVHKFLQNFRSSGYAIFHKEPNIAYPVDNKNFAVEYSFIRMNKTFWEYG